MKDLINIQIKDNQQLVSARELYKGLRLKIRFSLWVSKNFESFEEKTLQAYLQIRLLIMALESQFKIIC